MTTGDLEMLTRAQLIDLNNAVERAATIKEPGQVLTDADGTPTAVMPTRIKSVVVYGAIVSKAEVAAAGLTNADLPNLRII